MSHTRVRSVFLITLALAGTLTALFPGPGQGAQGGRAQQPEQAPASTVSVQVPLEHYHHFDLEPGADFDAAVRAVRALKERQAREWAWAKPLYDGQDGVEPFQIYPGTPDRWGTPGAYGQPEIITWSLASDDADYFSTSKNQLFSWMNTQFGAPSNWIWRIEAGFQRWSEMTGITFVRVQYQGNEWDDGAAYGLPGAPGLRGDIRIFAHAIAGPGNPLAIAEPPAGIPPAPSPGEITFGLELWATTPWNPLYGFERSIHHEIGHAIGLDHTCPAQSNTKLMQPFASTPFGTPQHDDVRGAQALYGDPLEPNDTREQASYFQIYPHSPVAHVPTIWPPPDSIVYPDGILGIDNFSDHDWFEFGLVTGVRMTVKVRPVGGPYQDWPVNPTPPFDCPATGGSVNSGAVTPLSVQVWRSIDANDDVLLAEISAPAGSIAQLTNVLLKFPGRYRIHVYGTPITVPKQSQQYELEVTWDGAPCPNDNYCSDGIPQNGTENCIDQGACVFTYFDDDYDFDSILDSMEPWLGDCDSNGRVDIGETAYLSSGQQRTKIRGQDDCEDAQPIAVGIDYEYMTYYATPDVGAGTPSSGEPGVWFTYTPQTNGVVSVQVRSHIQTPMELAMSVPVGGNCSAPTLIAPSQIEWSPFGQPLNQLAEITLEGQANVEYRIRVSGSYTNPYPAGDFTIRVDGPHDVTNDCDKNGTIDVCQTSAPDCNNNGIIDSCELVGATNHCLLSENAWGPGSIISAAGSLSVSANDLVLVAEGATPNMVGIFVASISRLPVAEEGKICLAGTVLRLGSGVQVGADGVAVMPLDLTQYPQMSAGSIWNFQFWFRDIGGPGIGYVDANVSDAIELKFCP